MNVPLFQCIDARLAKFAQFLDMERGWSGKDLIVNWLNGGSSMPPTWQSLVDMLASVEELASLSKKLKLFLTQGERKAIDLSKEVESFIPLKVKEEESAVSSLEKKLLECQKENESRCRHGCMCACMHE